MSARIATAWVAWTLGLLTLVLAAGAVALHAGFAGPAQHGNAWWATNVALALGVGLPGMVLAASRPSHPVGWLFLGAALAEAVTGASRELGAWALAHGRGGAAWGLWVGDWAWLASIGTIGPALLLLPDGRLPSRRWRPVLWALVVLSAGTIVAAALYPGPLDSPSGTSVANPLGLAALGGALDAAIPALTSATAVLTLAALTALAMRWRRAIDARRRQLGWIVAGAALIVAEGFAEALLSDATTSVTAPLATAAFAVTVAVAILRHGLFDLNRVVSRTLAYGALTACLVGAYLGLVLASQAVLERTGATVLATAAIALLFAPLRERLQRAADRLVYGQRSDPYAVIASVGASHALAPGADRVLPAFVETLARTLKLPYAALRLEDGSDAVYGSAPGDVLALPLQDQGQSLGRLEVAARHVGGRFSPDERRLLDDVARQAAAAARAVLLTKALQRSRQRLVSAREEERRRLRRDLHDGLGPVLAGVTLQLGSARLLLRDDADAVDRLLAELVVACQDAIADVRRLVYDLRPPALDELGLAAAVQEQAARLTQGAGLQLRVEAPAQLPEMSAAVEVAAYRIAAEAITNVARHAAARTCRIRLSVNGALQLDIADDGVGLPPGWRAGVGLTSIRERAAELGGSCTIERGRAGGTLVSARLPVAPA